jgi:Family of unknown function (DUF5719)
VSRPRHERAPGPDRAPDAVRRFRALVMVAVVVVAGALAATKVGSAAPATVALQPAVVASRAAPAGAPSSAWYCTGGTGPAYDAAESTLLVVDDGPRPAAGTMTVVAGTGKQASARFEVPAGGEVQEDPGRVVPGYWLASRVVLTAGAITVSNLVRGPSGWAVAPCATETSANWYFATGSTSGGDQLYVSLFNPTPTLAVADLSFATSHGVSQPQPFQGLIVAPGAVVTAEVAAYVQDTPTIATEVSARSGQVVASELEVHAAGGLSGVSLRLGAPALSRTWNLPLTDDPQGGASAVSVYNPTPAAERVHVVVSLGSGPVAPFDQTVAAGSVWSLDASQQTRIPLGTPYELRVSASGGPGVVVERSVAEAAAEQAPQWQAVTAVPGAAATACWVVPSVAVQGSAPGSQLSVELQNPTGRPVTAAISSVTPAGTHPLAGLARVHLAPHGFRVVRGGSTPIQVAASGRLVVTAGVVGTGGTAAVPVPAAPQG